MKSIAINVSPSVVHWIEQYISGDHEMRQKIEQWKSSNGAATLADIQKMSKKTKIPFGYFFLPEPPKEELPILECRTLQGERRPPSRDFIDTLYRMERIQDWMRNDRIRAGEQPLPFVGCMQTNRDMDVIVGDMRKTLSLEVTWYDNCQREKCLTFLKEKLEWCGVLVLQFLH